MWSRGPPEAHTRSFSTNVTFFLNTVFPGVEGDGTGDGTGGAFTCSLPEMVGGGAYPTIWFCRLTCFFCFCSISQSLSWQQLCCRRSAALCSMATIWQLSTLLQRLVPLPSPNTFSYIIKPMARNQNNEDVFHSFDAGTAGNCTDCMRRCHTWWQPRYHHLNSSVCVSVGLETAACSIKFTGFLCFSHHVTVFCLIRWSTVTCSCSTACERWCSPKFSGIFLVYSMFETQVCPVNFFLTCSVKILIHLLGPLKGLSICGFPFAYYFSVVYCCSWLSTKLY